MEIFITLIAGSLIIAAVAQAGSTAPVKAHKYTVRRQSSHKINVNVDGHKARTITVKAHTRIVGA